MDFSSMFGDADIDIECENCASSFKVKLKDLSKNNAKVKCPKCGANINVEHKPETQKTIRDINKGLNDFEKALKNFGK